MKSGLIISLHCGVNIFVGDIGLETRDFFKLDFCDFTIFFKNFFYIFFCSLIKERLLWKH